MPRKKLYLCKRYVFKRMFTHTQKTTTCGATMRRKLNKQKKTSHKKRHNCPWGNRKGVIRKRHSLQAKWHNEPTKQHSCPTKRHS